MHASRGIPLIDHMLNGILIFLRLKLFVLFLEFFRIFSLITHSSFMRLLPLLRCLCILRIFYFVFLCHSCLLYLFIFPYVLLCSTVLPVLFTFFQLHADFGNEQIKCHIIFSTVDHNVSLGSGRFYIQIMHGLHSIQILVDNAS